ncbi:hypothetical protein AVEN_174126-1 [Araneus ventricosus]|uniref:Uncharacterized protein n=1 Tax=Araneus ventricosus TaxID=182803 RepID=A0A4Y2T414_ARAVE|nr:hypothetical protein AVEN_174126-1 [Araneus ventricosus]
MALPCCYEFSKLQLNAQQELSAEIPAEMGFCVKVPIGAELTVMLQALMGSTITLFICHLSWKFVLQVPTGVIEDYLSEESATKIVYVTFLSPFRGI